MDVRTILFIVSIIIFLGVLYVEWMAAWRLPPNAPSTFARKGRDARTEKLVVCAGDSITHAIISADYVELLREQFGPEYEFVNAGINASLTFNLLDRMDGIVACQPDIVTVLIGTNDVNATLRERSYKYYRRKMGFPKDPNIDTYRENLQTIISRLKNETSATIAILSLPVLGENLDDPANKKVETYNQVVQEIAKAEDLTYLPLWEAQIAHLKEQTPSNQVYEGRKGNFYFAAFQRYILRLSWDTIGQWHNFHLMTDYIHLNDRSARMVAELVGEWLKGLDS